jgi:hypothetical protein
VLHCAAQKLADKSTCTYNLHLLACQLLLQALQRGITYELFELWVERLIGEYKQRVKYRTRSEPEKTMMGDDMQKRALQKWRLQYPDVQTWEEVSGKQPKLGRQQQSRFCSESGEVVGTGQQIQAEQWRSAVQLLAALRKAIQCNIGDLAEQQAWLDNWGSVTASWYKEALLVGGHYATSTAFSRSRSRDGTFVLIPFTTSSNGDVKQTVARVSRYLRLCLPSGVAGAQHSRILLFAVCDLLPYTKPQEDEDICGLDSMILLGKDKGSRQDTYQSLDYPVLLSNITSPLFRQEFEGQDGTKWWAFVPLHFKTGGKRH